MTAWSRAGRRRPGLPAGGARAPSRSGPGVIAVPAGRWPRVRRPAGPRPGPRVPRGGGRHRSRGAPRTRSTPAPVATGSRGSSAGCWPPAVRTTSASRAARRASTGPTTSRPRSTCTGRASGCGDAWQVCVTGTVAHTSLGGPRILVERSVVASTGRRRSRSATSSATSATEPVGVPLLYHVNLGAPLLRPGARLEVDAGRVGGARAAARTGRHPLVTPAPGARSRARRRRAPRRAGGARRDARRRRRAPRRRRRPGPATPCPGCARGAGPRAAPTCSASSPPTPRCSARSATCRTPARPCSSPARPGAPGSASPIEGLVHESR